MSKLHPTNIREYGDKLGVDILTGTDRLMLVAYNEAGHNSISIDLLDVLEFVKTNEYCRILNEHRNELRSYRS